MSTTATPRSRTRGPSASPAERTAWAVVVAVLIAIGVTYARARWPGALPIGSDNDEYQMAGAALAAFEAPLVAGVEGTKYPLGYPALLAVLEWLRLPVAPGALVLNLAALAGTVGGVAHLAGRGTATSPANPGAALAAGGVVVASAAVWNDVYSVMPELLLLMLVVVVLSWLQRPLTMHRIVVLTVLAVAAVLLKTLAVLLFLGGCALLWLVAQRWPRPVAGAADMADVGPRHAVLLLPAVAAVGAVLAGMLAVRGLPEHTTGYLATFALRDPFDASLGRLGPAGLIERTLTDVPETLLNLGRAIALIEAGTAVASAIAIVAFAAGIVAAFRLRPGSPLGVFTAGATTAFVIGLTAWPYHSPRFGLPLVPVAALGAGWVVRTLTDRFRAHRGAGAAHADERVGRHVASLAVGGTITALLVATSWAAVTEQGRADEARLAAQHAALDELAAFVEREIGGAPMASFDYREVAHRLGRPVAPLSYTSDTDVLLAQVGDAAFVVGIDVHHARNRQLGLMLEAEPDRFTPVLQSDGLDVYRVED